MNSPFAPPSLFPPGAATDALKTAFAVALLRNPDAPFVAGTEVFGADAGKALYAASHWINDPIVDAEKRRMLKEKGPRAFLPSKEDYAREVWKLATDSKTNIEDKARFMQLYGDIMGYKQQAEKGGTHISVTQNRVMIVKDHGSDADWEAQAAAQQHKLASGHDVTDVPHRTVQ